MPTSTPTPTPTPLPTPMALVASVNAYNPINLYEEPDARSRVVGALAPGTLVPILEISESGMWLKVGLDVVGWVAGTQVSLSGTFYAHAGTSPTRRGLIQSDTAVNVRNGPGTSSRVLGQIKAGQVVDVDGWSDDGKWAQIPYNGVEGWVALSTVILTGGEPTATPAVTEEVTREP